jgi:hypothetical protein
MYMCTIIIMLIWYNTGAWIYTMMMVDMHLYCTRSTWWWWYTCTCIAPYLHDDGTHVPVLYQIYMIMVPSSCRSGTIQVHVYHHHVDLVQDRYMCTISWWYTCTCIAPDLHVDDGTHVPVLYQIYMMMVHMYLYCTRPTSWWYTCTCIVPDHHHHVDLVQYRYMCIIIM